MEKKGHERQNARDDLSVIVQDLIAPLERYVDVASELFSEISTPPSQIQERETITDWRERDNRALKNQIQIMLRELGFHMTELKAWRENEIMSGQAWYS
jgi:hypothetical protein